MPDTARPINRHPPDSSRSTHQSPVLMSSHALRHVINGSLAFAFSDHTCRLNVRLFRDAHHASLQLTQLTVVWNPRLHNDSEGPTFISSTAFQSSDPGFYIRTSQSHSGHTVALAEEDEVVEGCGSAVGPVNDVVGFAHGWGSAADDAAFVTSVEGSAQRAGDEAFLGADVEGFGVRAEDERDDPCVAGESSYGGCGQGIAMHEIACAACGLEVFEIDRDRDVRLDVAVSRDRGSSPGSC